MDLNEALDTLGVRRVVWIDDIFAKTSQDLFRLLMANMDVTKTLDYPGLKANLNEYDTDGQALGDFLERLGRLERDALEEEYFAASARLEAASTVELRAEAVGRTAALLGVLESDRWTFEAAREAIPTVCKQGDSDVGYIVDLSNGLHAPEEGIETLRQLANSGSRGTMFVLTHEATVSTEGLLEASIRAKLAELVSCPPVCVISKDRIKKAKDDAQLIDSLKIAVKRAGLRRILHQVLDIAKSSVENSFQTATELLLSIPPEQLDTFIVDRGYNEGVSELHVVERALTAKMSDEFRALFSKNDVISKAQRLREFRSIDLNLSVVTGAHENLEIFRRLEILESGDLINASFSPVSSGDVFVLDEQEFRGDGFTQRRFLLLGQPCDVQIRTDGKRDAATAFLIPLTDVADPSAPEKFKSRRLPFKMDGKILSCNFREATAARLDILDLASFRSDGRVAFDDSQANAPRMLPGLEKAYESRTKLVATQLGKAPAAPLDDARFCLTFNTPRFKQIYTAKHASSEKATIRGTAYELKNRVTWSIRRECRIKPSYAASLLRDFLSVSGRDAFDVDFTTVNQPETPLPKVCA